MTEDLFEQYYTEKLWETIPSIYRHEDGLAEKPGTLRAIVQTIAKQAAILRRSQDRLWDDQFIDLCDEWAVPYIGELVATRLLSSLIERSRRIDVAKTIYYRRRKGTPAILEELIHDISGWEGKLVEQFQKLVRTRHGLDMKPAESAGVHSGTMPGGWADLRNKHTAELSNGPFEEFFHTCDFRKHRGLNGRYNIPKLAFYLYRLKAYEAIGVTPFALADNLCYSFDPSGRDIPLFSKSLRNSTFNRWHSATEAEVPGPIACRLLGQEFYELTYEIIQQLTTVYTVAVTDLLKKLAGQRFQSRISLINMIETFPLAIRNEIMDVAKFPSLLKFSLTEDCGKYLLLPDETTTISNPLDENSIFVGVQAGAVTNVFTTEFIRSADLFNWPFAISDEIQIDAERGLFMLKSVPLPGEVLFAAYHYGFSGPIGAGSYERPWVNNIMPDLILKDGVPITPAELTGNNIVRIDDSFTYSLNANINNISRQTVYAANSQRPYIRLLNNWEINSGGNENAILVLDGLWIGTSGILASEIILKGNFECVVIRNCTLDPGGSDNIAGDKIEPISLIIDGFVETLCIESSILGPIKIINNGLMEELEISDSIIQSVDAAIPAIENNKGKTILNRSTVFGDINVHRMEASECLFTGIVDVTDTQNGCIRFSAAQEDNRLPHPYECFLFKSDCNHWFTSRLFGNPGFAQLSETAPSELVRGAENGSEMGAFSSLLNPIKFDGLKSKVEEYMPFGLIPIYINKT